MERAGGESPRAKDGRAARAARTRAAILAALAELLACGRTQPTVDEIAAAAGVSPRTVFQHFPDRGRLWFGIAERQLERVVEATSVDPEPTDLERRVTAFVVERAALLEQLAPVLRATAAIEATPAAAGLLTELHRHLRVQTQRVFFDVAGEPPVAVGASGAAAELVAAACLATSGAAWLALRGEQRLEPAAAAAVMRRTLLAVLAFREPAFA